MTDAFGQRDPWEHPETKAWAKRVLSDMLPKLTSSAISMTVYSGKTDVKLAVEVGFSILLDKPIILMVLPGAKVPNKLAMVADEIVEGNLKGSADTQAALMAAIERIRTRDA
jgi:hypothetical protein